MAIIDVISGRAVLDITPFTTALKALQTETDAAVAKLQSTLSGLGLGTSSALSGVATSSAKAGTAMREAGTNAGVLSTNLKKAEQDLRNTENAFNSIYKAGSQLARLGTTMSVLGAGINAVMIGAMEGAKQFDFWTTKAIAATQATDALGRPVQDAAVNFKSMESAIEGVAESVGAFSPEQVAQAYYLWATATGVTIKSQQDLAAVSGQVDIMLKAAAISGDNSATVIRGVAGILGEYGLSVADAGNATAIMLNITQQTDAEFSDMLQAFKMIGPSAKAMGLDIGQTAAIIGELSQSNIKGTMAGRDLQRIFDSFVNPTTKSQAVLQELLGTTDKLGRNWHDILFPGNQFVGMLDKVDNGVIVQKGAIGLLADSLNKLGPAQAEQALKIMETENGYRGLLPLIEAYRKGALTAADGTKQGTNEMEQYAQQLDNTALQGQLFNDKWGQVSQSIEVVLGQQLNRLKFGLIDLGEAAKSAFIPFISKLADAVEGMRKWGEENSGLLRQVMQIAGVIATAAIALGTFGFVVGHLTEAIASLQTVGNVLKVVALASQEWLVPLLAIGAAIGLTIYAIGQFAGSTQQLKDEFQKLGQAIKDMVSVLTTALGDLVGIIGAIIQGDYAKALKYAEDLALTFAAGFANIFKSLQAIVATIFQGLVKWLDQTFNGLGTAMVTWGKNVMAAFASGMIQAINAYIVPAINAVIQMISNFFEGHSPPKEGPLSHINEWGKNTMQAYLDGMKDANFQSVSDVATQIGDLLNNLGVNQGTAKYTQAMSGVQTAMKGVLEGTTTLAQAGQEAWQGLASAVGPYGDAINNVIQKTMAVQGIKNVISDIKNQIAELQAQINEIEQTQVQPLQNQIDSNNLEKEKLQLLQAEQQAQLDNLEVQKDAEQIQKDHLQDQKDDIQDAESAIQDKIDGINDIRAGYQDELDVINDQTTAINDQISAIQRKYQEQQAGQQLVLAQMKDQLDIAKAEEDAQLQPLQDQANALKDQLTLLKEKNNLQTAPLSAEVALLRATGHTEQASRLQKQLSILQAEHQMAEAQVQQKLDATNYQIDLQKQQDTAANKQLQDQYNLLKDKIAVEDAIEKSQNEATISDLNLKKEQLEDEKLLVTQKLHASDAELRNLQAQMRVQQELMRGVDAQMRLVDAAIRRINDAEIPFKEAIKDLERKISLINLANQKLQLNIDIIRNDTSPTGEKGLKDQIANLQNEINGRLDAQLNAAEAALTVAKDALTVAKNNGAAAKTAQSPLFPTNPNGAIGLPDSGTFLPPDWANNTAANLASQFGDSIDKYLKVLDPFAPISASLQKTKDDITAQMAGIGGGILGSIGGLFGGQAGGILSALGINLGLGKAPIAPTLKRRAGHLGLLDEDQYNSDLADYAKQLEQYNEQQRGYNLGQQRAALMRQRGTSMANSLIPFGLGTIPFLGRISGGFEGAAGLFGKLGGGLEGLEGLLGKQAIYGDRLGGAAKLGLKALDFSPVEAAIKTALLPIQLATKGIGAGSGFLFPRVPGAIDATSGFFGRFGRAVAGLRPPMPDFLTEAGKFKPEQLDLFSGLPEFSTAELAKMTRRGLPPEMFGMKRIPRIGAQAELFGNEEDFGSFLGKGRAVAGEGPGLFSRLFELAGKGLGGGKDLGGDLLGKLFGGVGKLFGAGGETLTKLPAFIGQFTKISDILAGTIKGFEGIGVAVAKLVGVFGKFFEIFQKIPVLGKLLSALSIVGWALTIIQIIQTLKSAWDTNWNGIRDALQKAWADIHPIIDKIVSIFNSKDMDFADKVGQIGQLLGQAFGKLKDDLAPVVEKTVGQIRDGLGNFFKNLGPQLSKFWSQYGQGWVQDLGRGFANLVGGLVNFILTNALPWALNLIAGFYHVLTNFFNHLDDLVNGKGGASQGGGFGDWFKSMVGQLVQFIIANAPSWGENIGKALWAVLTAAFQLLLAIGKLLLDIFVKIGGAILDGLKQAIQAGWNAFWTWVKGLFNDFVQGIKDFLGIASPSKVFSDIGEAIVNGLLQGIKNVAAAATALIDWFTNTVITPFFNFFTATLPSWAGTQKDNFVAWWDQTITNMAGAVSDFEDKITAWFREHIMVPLFRFFVVNLPQWATEQKKHISDWWSTVITNITSAPGEFEQKFKDWFENSIFGNFFSWVEKTVPNWVAREFLYLQAWWLNTIHKIKDAIGGPDGDGWLGKIVSAVKSIFDGLWNWFKDFINNKFFEKIKDLLGQIGDIINNAIQGAINKIKPGLMSFIEGFIGDLQKKWGDIQQLIKNITGANTNPQPQGGGNPPPAHATGTDFAEGGLSLVGEQGPELVTLQRGSRVIPNSRLGTSLSDALASVLSPLASLTRDIASAISGGFSNLSSNLAYASAQPAQITKTMNFYIDKQYLNSESDMSYWVQQTNMMGNQ